MDPNVGRFTQEDPAGFRGGISFYGYVGNDPVNYTDPMGLEPMCCKYVKMFGVPPEAVCAITAYEKSWRNPITDIQDFATFITGGAYGGPTKDPTVGSAQISAGWAANIEKGIQEFPGAESIRHLLPPAGTDTERRWRLIDDAWAFKYASAQVFLSVNRAVDKCGILERFKKICNKS